MEKEKNVLGIPVAAAHFWPVFPSVRRIFDSVASTGDAPEDADD